MFVQHIAGLSGLAAAVLFIFGLKRMSSPVTALSGIVVAGLGMVVAVALLQIVGGDKLIIPFC